MALLMEPEETFMSWILVGSLVLIAAFAIFANSDRISRISILDIFCIEFV